MLRLLTTTFLVLLLNTVDPSMSIAVDVTAESLKTYSDDALADLLAKTEREIKICQAKHYVAKYKWVARDSGAFAGLTEDEITLVFNTVDGIKGNAEEEALRCITANRKLFLLVKAEILRRLSGVVEGGEADRRKKIEKMKQDVLHLQRAINLHNKIMKKLGGIKVEPGMAPRNPLNDDEKKAVDDVLKVLHEWQEELSRDTKGLGGGGKGGDGNR